MLVFNLLTWEEASKGATLTFRAALLEAPLRWWLLGSLLGFLLFTLFWIVDRGARAAGWAFKKRSTSHGLELPSAGRRRFLEQTATAFCAAPFVAGAYGLFYGRLNLEVTHQRIRLARLPKAFEGFRIVQLSDLHVSAFMSADEIRSYAAIANGLKPDLVALTGDFLTWDATVQGAVVEALSGLKAPFGVFGCLGNHEWLTETEDLDHSPFLSPGDAHPGAASVEQSTCRQQTKSLGCGLPITRRQTKLQGMKPNSISPAVERLLIPDTVNILLSHNPNTFDRAAQLGVDLSLSGHTHGGQVAVEFKHCSLAAARLMTPYIRGWFQKGDAQLYVNRGIGTITFPIRIGARPEITVLELERGA